MTATLSSLLPAVQSSLPALPAPTAASCSRTLPPSTSSTSQGCSTAALQGRSPLLLFPSLHILMLSLSVCLPFCFSPLLHFIFSPSSRLIFSRSALLISPSHLLTFSSPPLHSGFGTNLGLYGQHFKFLLTTQCFYVVLIAQICQEITFSPLPTFKTISESQF